MQKRISLKIGLILTLIIQSIFFGGIVSAATSVPEKFIYEARLLNAAGSAPKTTTHTFRFSLWAVSGVAAGDLSGGLIDILAPNYSDWQEVQSVIPNNDGFFSLELGVVTPLPDPNYLRHLYLQVEVKENGQPDTSFEVLDRAPSDPASDRSPIGSVPYAMNADTLDDADIGVNDGDLVVLGVGDVFLTAVIPGGTDQDAFVIDADDSNLVSIGLQFGATLGKILSWENGPGYFNFNDDVNIQGDLTITGTVDGVDISTLASNVNLHLDGGASKHDASEIDVEAIDGHYYSVGDVETAIDDLDEKLFTMGAGASTNQKLIMPSIYEGVSYKADGIDNIGRLFFDSDIVANRNYYVWTSTRPTLQDYDVIVQVPLPIDFTGWNGVAPWTFNYHSTNGANTENKADIYIYDTNGALVTLTGSSSGLASTSWAQTSLGYAGSPTFTAGETFMLVIKMSSQQSEEMHVGEIVLDYQI